MALAPVATVISGETARHVGTGPELQSVLASLALPASAARRYRGLAGTDLPVLAATCVDPATRTLRRLGVADAEAAIAIFGK